VTRSQDSPAKDSTQAILKHWREAVPNDRMAHLVKDATRALVRALQMRLNEHSVSFGHWTFLRILWETDGLSQRELSQQAGVMEPTTFSALKSMEKLGLVTRKQLLHNRRKVLIHLTHKGKLLKRKLVPLATEVNDIALGGVPPAHIATTRGTLLAMIENLARNEQESGKRKRLRSTRELGELVATAGRRTRGGLPTAKKKQNPKSRIGYQISGNSHRTTR
jgi:DNA-binding MarR family transcriptional regulator